MNLTPPSFTASTAQSHILIVVENLPVPLDRRVWLEATSCVRAGYVVSIISPMGLGWVEPYEILEGVHIYRHPVLAEARSGILDYAREYSHAIWHWFRLAKIVWQRCPFDVIQGCNPPDLIFVLALRYRWQGVRYMFDHHDVCPELLVAKFGKRSIVYWLMRLLERLSFAVASVSLATNESFRKIAITRGRKSESDVFVVRSAPNIDHFIPAEGEHFYREKAKTVLGYVGVIGAQEGMEILVSAASHLIRAHRQTDVHFVIIGFGSALDSMIRQVSDLKLTEYFTFTGALYQADLIAALNAIDIGLACDPKNPMNDMSTMNKVMEYMALGKPVVQFDLVEGRVSAGSASLYAKLNDPTDFADKINLLVNDRDLRGTMGAEGRRRMLNELSWTYSEPHLLAAYARIFSKMKS